MPAEPPFGRGRFPVTGDGDGAAVTVEPVGHPHSRALRRTFDASAGPGTSLLHLEQPGEVSVHAHAQRDARRFPAQVAHGDALHHAGADIAGTEHQQRAVGRARARRSLPDERRGIRGRAPHRQRLEPLPVHRQLQTAHKTGVPVEQALPASLGDVTAAVADAEAHALHDRDDPRRARRWAAGRGAAIPVS